MTHHGWPGPHADPLRSMALMDDEACAGTCKRCEAEALVSTIIRNRADPFRADVLRGERSPLDGEKAQL